MTNSLVDVLFSLVSLDTPSVVASTEPHVITKLFYALFIRLVSSVRQSLPPDVDKWGVSLQLLMGAVVAGGAVTAACYHWMQQNVINDPDCVDADR